MMFSHRWQKQRPSDVDLTGKTWAPFRLTVIYRWPISKNGTKNQINTESDAALFNARFWADGQKIDQNWRHHLGLLKIDWLISLLSVIKSGRKGWRQIFSGIQKLSSTTQWWNIEAPSYCWDVFGFFCNMVDRILCVKDAGDCRAILPTSNLVWTFLCHFVLKVSCTSHLLLAENQRYCLTICPMTCGIIGMYSCCLTSSK